MSKDPRNVDLTGNGRIVDFSHVQMGPCGSCAAANAGRKCGGCKQFFYCDRECQTAHWKLHRKECKYIQKYGTRSGGLDAIGTMKPQQAFKAFAFDKGAETIKGLERVAPPELPEILREGMRVETADKAHLEIVDGTLTAKEAAAQGEDASAWFLPADVECGVVRQEGDRVLVEQWPEEIWTAPSCNQAWLPRGALRGVRAWYRNTPERATLDALATMYRGKEREVKVSGDIHECGRASAERWAKDRMERCIESGQGARCIEALGECCSRLTHAADTGETPTITKVLFDAIGRALVPFIIPEDGVVRNDVRVKQLSRQFAKWLNTLNGVEYAEGVRQQQLTKDQLIQQQQQQQIDQAIKTGQYQVVDVPQDKLKALQEGAAGGGGGGAPAIESA
jgi:hypothetical protein